MIDEHFLIRSSFSTVLFVVVEQEKPTSNLMIMSEYHWKRWGISKENKITSYTESRLFSSWLEGKSVQVEVFIYICSVYICGT